MITKIYKGTKGQISLLFVICSLFFSVALTSCTDDQDWSTDATHSRLFGVSSSISVDASENSAEITFKGVPNADSYTIELNTDSLYDDLAENANGKSIILYTTKENKVGAEWHVIISDQLIGDTQYYLRIRATSTTINPSRWVYYQNSKGYGYFKTKAEQIFNNVDDADRSESSVRLTWNAAKEVTHITVNKGDEVVQTIQLDAAAKAAGEYIVTGLNPSTTYKFAIWKDDAKRGEITVATTAAMPAGDYKYTLTPDVTVISNDLLKSYAEIATAEGKTNYSVTIGIPAGATIDFHGTTESGEKSNVKVPDGMAVTFFGMAGGEAPTIKFQKNLDIEGSHAFIAFENVKVVNDGAGYFVNQSAACGISEFTIKDCEMSGFGTSFFRFQKSDAKNIDKVTLTNSIFHDMCNGYSFFHIDADKGNGGGVKNIYMDGCTLYNIATAGKMFIYSRDTDMENIVVSNCTFYNCIGNGNFWVDFDKNGKGCQGDYKFVKCLFTKTPDEVTNKNVRGATNPVFDGCFKTTDFFKVFDGCGELDYDAAALFTDPATGDFTMKKELNCGDPRWFKQD